MIPADAGGLRSLGRLAGLSGLGEAWRAIVAAAIVLMVSRTQGLSSVGILALAVAVTSALPILASLGFIQSARRYAARYDVAGDRRSLVSLLIYASAVAGAVSLAFAVTLLIWAEPLANGLFGEEQMTGALRIVALAIPVRATFTVTGSVLEGCGILRKRLMGDNFLIPSLRVLMTAGALLAWPDNELGPVWAYALSHVVVGIPLTIQSFADLLPGVAARWPSRDQQRLWWSMALRSLPASMSYILSGSSIVLLALGVAGSTEEVGVLNVALQVTQLMLLPLAALQAVTPSFFARAHARDDGESLAAVYHLSSQASFALAGSAFLGLVASGTIALRAFGADVGAEAYAALLILAGGRLAESSTGSIGALLTMTGHPERGSQAIVVMYAVALASCAVLVPAFGLVGAALAYLVTFATLNLFRWVQARRLLGISAVTRGWLIAAATIVVLLPFALAIRAFSPAPLVPLLALVVALAALAYSLLQLSRVYRKHLPQVSRSVAADASG